MPSGTRPFANGNLHRVQTRTDVRGSTATPASRRLTCETDHSRHVRAYLRNLSYERYKRAWRHARPFRTAFVLSVRGGNQNATGCGSRAGKNEGHLHAMPHDASD